MNNGKNQEESPRNDTMQNRNLKEIKICSEIRKKFIHDEARNRYKSYLAPSTQNRERLGANHHKVPQKEKKPYLFSVSSEENEP